MERICRPNSARKEPRQQKLKIISKFGETHETDSIWSTRLVVSWPIFLETSSRSSGFGRLGICGFRDNRPIRAGHEGSDLRCDLLDCGFLLRCRTHIHVRNRNTLSVHETYTHPKSRL